MNVSDFALDVIGPVVLLIAFGYFLYKQNKVTDSFVQTASGLIFNFALPTLLFVNISSADLSVLINIKSVSIGVSATLIVFLLCIFLISPFVTKNENKGVLTQGIFRSNMGIIGLAYCAKAYGDEGLALAAVYMGCLTILYNILSVFVLNLYHDSQTSILSIMKKIVTNPIILGICLGIIVAFLNVRLPDIVNTTLGYFSQLTLPLALICTGAALRFTALGTLWKVVCVGVIGKCIFYPFIMVILAISFDINGMMLGILFLMAISPTAAASYVMVKKLGGNHQLAAQLIAVSTVVSLPLTIIGFYVLTQFADVAF